MRAPIIALIVFLAMLSYYLSIAEPAPKMNDRYYPGNTQSKCSGAGMLASLNCNMREVNKAVKARTREIDN